MGDVYKTAFLIQAFHCINKKPTNAYYKQHTVSHVGLIILQKYENTARNEKKE